jgi:hypothetical protein
MPVGPKVRKNFCLSIYAWEGKYDDSQFQNQILCFSYTFQSGL